MVKEVGVSANSAETGPRRKRRVGVLGSVVALLLLAGLGWLSWHLTHPDKTAAGAPGAAAGGARRGAPALTGRRGAPATTVGLATAKKADVPVVLEALGTVTPVANVTVRPQVSGVIKRIEFKEGQMVKAGQLLATIDPQAFDIALQQARGQLQRDQAQLEDAKVSLQRFNTLLSQDSIARQTVDTQAALVKQLEGTVVTDRAAVASAQLNLGYSRITSPVAGRVGLRVIDEGNYIGAGDSAGVAVVTQIAPIDVEFAVPQDRVTEIQEQATKGGSIRATALDRSRTTTLDVGTFSTLDNKVDTTTGTVRAKARFANAKGLLFPSQFVNLRLLVRTEPGVVVVPIAAVRHSSDGDFTYLLNRQEQTVSVRKVTRGLSTDDRVVIASGLQAGDEVITEGGDRLSEGAHVQLPGQAAAAAASAASGARSASGASGASGAHAA
ncbi:MAG: efflux transporter, family, subunit, partial [Rhizobacter sp.]|nr:efflux transporter, family, subunit [Rhizobacter sp.]